MEQKTKVEHLWEIQPTREQLTKRIHAWSMKINKSEKKLEATKQHTEVSLMSIAHYIDPRIVVAWCIRNSVSIDMVLSTKPEWALKAESDWRFGDSS